LEEEPLEVHNKLVVDMAAGLQAVDMAAAVLVVDTLALQAVDMAVVVLAADTAGPLAVGMPGVAVGVEVLPVGNSDNGNNTIGHIAVYNSLEYRIVDNLSFSPPL
jgi:hypothetical protein